MIMSSRPPAIRPARLGTSSGLERARPVPGHLQRAEDTDTLITRHHLARVTGETGDPLWPAISSPSSCPSQSGSGVPKIPDCCLPATSWLDGPGALETRLRPHRPPARPGAAPWPRTPPYRGHTP
jgi:hypothetical protein